MLEERQIKEREAWWTDRRNWIEKGKETRNEEALENLSRILRGVGTKSSASQEAVSLYNQAQSIVLSIPGHAQHFAEQLAEARRITEKPWLDNDYQRLYLQIRDTMIHLPSSETISVLGGMLETQEDLWTKEERVAIWKEQSEKGFQSGIVPSPLRFADSVFNGIGLRESSGYPPNGTRDTVLNWWSRVKSGEVAISFEGQAVEYRLGPDGTWDVIYLSNPTGALVTPPQTVNPLFPASGPATGSFNGLHAKSKFLAAPLPGSPGEKQ